MDELFAKAQGHIAALQTRVQQLEIESQEKDRQLVELGAEIPVVWITGPGRHRAKTELAGRSSAASIDGLHPLVLDTKYYTAYVHLHTSDVNSLEDRQHAVIVALGDEQDAFDVELVQEAFGSVGEVRILLTNDATASDWCVEEGVEWVQWSDASGRLSESLQSTMWPNMIMKPKSGVVSSEAAEPSKQMAAGAATSDARKVVEKTRKRKEMDAEQELEVFEKLMSQAKQVRDSASTLSDEERRRRAAAAAEHMMKLLGMEEDEED